MSCGGRLLFGVTISECVTLNLRHLAPLGVAEEGPAHDDQLEQGEAGDQHVQGVGDLLPDGRDREVRVQARRLVDHKQSNLEDHLPELPVLELAADPTYTTIS